MQPDLRSLTVIQIGDYFVIYSYNANRSIEPVRYIKGHAYACDFLFYKKSTSSVAFISCYKQDKRPPVEVAFYIIRHLASFPQSSIIAATRLDFCVRNGNRYFPGAMDTEVRL